MDSTGGSGAGGTTAGGGGAGGTAAAAGTTGAGGTTSAGGTTGMAGTTANGGAGGTGGTTGTAGTTANGGAGGTTGNGGSGGRGGSGSGGTGGASSGLRLEYMNSSSAATNFSARLTNDGPSTPLISAIKVRYYFQDDTTNMNASPMVLAATWKIAGTSTMIDLRMTPGCAAVATWENAPRRSYVDATCPLPSPLGVSDTITMAIAIDPPAQIASNDYSYADTAGAFVPNDHLLILLNGVVVAGTPP